MFDQEVDRVVSGEAEQAKVDVWFSFDTLSFRATILIENGARRRRMAEEARKGIGF